MTIQHIKIRFSLVNRILNHLVITLALLNDLEQLIILPHSTSQHFSTLRIKLHSSSFSSHRFHIIKAASVYHLTGFNYQLQSILAILNVTLLLLIPQRSPILPNHRLSLFIQRKSTHINSIHFFPTQFQNSLVKQRTSPTLLFSHQILITMLSLKRHNLNLLTMNPFLLTMLSDVPL